MSFYIYDLGFLVLFGIFLTIFLYKNRKNLKREGIMLLYRTQIGVKIMDYLSKRYKKTLGKFEWVIIVFGYLMMAGGIFVFIRALYLFSKPEVVQAFKIPPLMPLIPYIPELFQVDFLPPLYFTYFIAILAAAAIPHEFFHGLFARVKNVKIKSTGFAFLGPFAAAFVEPDEDKVEKMKPRDQIPFLSAGAFANILTAVIFFFILWLFAISAYSPEGIVFGSYSVTVLPTENITITDNEHYVSINEGVNLTEIIYNNQSYYIDEIDKDREYNFAFHDSPALRSGLSGVIIEIEGMEIRDEDDLNNVLSKYNVGDDVTIITKLDSEKREYTLNLDASPGDEEKPYLGISPYSPEGFGNLASMRSEMLFFRDHFTYYKPRIATNLTIFIFNLLWWIILASFGVALVNMLPLGIFDGGRVFYSTIVWITGSKKIAKKAYSLATYSILAIFLLLMIFWAIHIF